MGKHMLRLLRFALRYPDSWHTYGTDRSTVNAVRRLSELGLLECNAVRQFRLRLGQPEPK